MGLAGALGGAICIGLVGALRHYRGVNETISSLLVAYIAIAIMNQLVEGPLRDPASLNKPSTLPIGDAYMLPAMPGHGRALGPGAGRHLLHRRLAPDGPYHLWLCGAASPAATRAPRCCRACRSAS